MSSQIHGYIGDYKVTHAKSPALFARYGFGSSLSMEWSADSDGVACDAVTIEQADGTLHECDERDIDGLPTDVLADLTRIAVDAAAVYRSDNGLVHRGYGR